MSREKKPSLSKEIPCPRCNGAGKVSVLDYEYLKYLRIKRGLSIKDFAATHKTHSSIICDIEHGRRLCPARILRRYQELQHD